MQDDHLAATPGPRPDPAAVAAAERRFALLIGLRWLPVGVQLPLIVLLPSARGLSAAEIGALSVLYSMVVVGLELPTGGLSDGRGRRLSLLGAAALTALGMAGFATATSLLGFAIVNVVLATGRALWSGSLEAWFVDALAAADPAASTSRGFGRSATAASVALGGMSLLSGLVFVGGGESPADALARAAMVAAVLGVVAGIGVLVLVTDPPDLVRADSSRAAVGAAWRRVRGDGELRKAIGVSAVHGWSLVTFELLVPLLLVAELGGEEQATRPLSILVAVAFVGVASGAEAATPWSHRVGSMRRPLAQAFGAIAVLMLVIGSRPGLAVIAGAYVLAYLALGAQHPLERTFVSRRTGPQDRASVLSISSLAFQLAGAGAALLLPWLLDWSGFLLAFGASAGVAAAGAVVATRLVDVRPS